MEAAIAVRKRENMVLEVVIDGVPYAEEAYVKDPIQYLATEYGAKYIKATRKPVKDICRFAQKHAEELDSISFVCRYEDKERLYNFVGQRNPQYLCNFICAKSDGSRTYRFRKGKDASVAFEKIGDFNRGSNGFWRCG